MAYFGSLCQRRKIKMAHAWESLKHKASAVKRGTNKKDAIAELKRVMAEADASSFSGTTPP
jgi:hypothetical protein